MPGRAVPAARRSPSVPGSSTLATPNRARLVRTGSLRSPKAPLACPVTRRSSAATASAGCLLGRCGGCDDPEAQGAVTAAGGAIHGLHGLDTRGTSRPGRTDSARPHAPARPVADILTQRDLAARRLVNGRPAVRIRSPAPCITCADQRVPSGFPSLPTLRRRWRSPNGVHGFLRAFSWHALAPLTAAASAAPFARCGGPASDLPRRRTAS
jgi:hypothetical protein